MDARVYFHLLDSIAAATNVTDLAAVRTLIHNTEMHRLEREALDRSITARERLLRVSEIEVERAAAPRAD